MGITEKELVKELDKLIIFLNKNDVNNVKKESKSGGVAYGTNTYK